MKWLVAVFALCALVSTIDCASDTIAWCYQDPKCAPPQWPTIAPNFCNGTRQSPINIVTAKAKENANLTDFTFVGYDSTTSMKKVENTGKTVKVTLDSGIQVSGGDLSERYDALQFHLHWGNGTAKPGSEHTIDGQRYPIELHIVNIMSSLNGNTTLAVANPNGLAALGFFIKEKAGSDTGTPASWKTLANYLANITNQGDSVNISPGVSLDDLLVGVNRSKYYRYFGSLTTPSCNEAVVWTVFKEPIEVSSDIINLFGRTVRIGNSTSNHMVDVYRNIQPDQEVSTQAASSSTSTTCYSLGLMALSLVLGRS